MTPEEQRAAIAEKCGWTSIEDYSQSLMMSKGMFVKGYPPRNALIGKKQDLPDYCSDLNAMHEAEKHLGSVNMLARYADELDKVCVPTHICPLTHWQSVVMATAAQRAEAFCRLFWPEGDKNL